MTTIAITSRTIGFFYLSAQIILGGLNTTASTSTMKVYEDGTEKLTVYTDVPGHETTMVMGTKPEGYPSRAKSDIYEIWVRSAASNNEWVQCFANMTYNRGKEMSSMKEFGSSGSTHGYLSVMGGWTHTYANIEMSENTAVEVEIRKIGTTKLNSSSVIVKSAVHPSQKVFDKQDVDGNVRFKINNPCQVVIDINGQMDDHNGSIKSGPGKQMVGNPPVHAVAFYANPIMAKPVASPENRIIRIHPNQSSRTVRLIPPSPSTYDTLVFAPGIHNIGGAFKVHPVKNYYIPGDAIVYGRMNNTGVSKNGYRSSGDKISIYGYGTLCGIQIARWKFDDNNPEYPEWNAWTGEKGGDAAIEIQNAWDLKITGVSITDPSSFNTKLDGGVSPSVKDNGLVSWVKLHSWRVNGDGIGGYIAVEDSFFRPTDDCTYVRAWRRRCTFWKDSNANIFKFIGHTGGGVEDCDVLYARWLGNRRQVFQFERLRENKPMVFDGKITVKDVRFHDKLLNPLYLIQMETSEIYKNLVFENISAYAIIDQKKSRLHGTEKNPLNGNNLAFKNFTFQNGLDGKPPIKLTQTNYKDYFEINEFVDESIFEK